MKYHGVVYQILDLLKQKNYWYQTFEHEPVRTSEEAAHVRADYSLSQGAKAIIIKYETKNKEQKYVMLVLPGDKKFSGGKVKKLLQTKEIRFANQDEISKLTGGVEIGGIPPFGNLFSLSVYVDPLILNNEKIIFNAGDRRFSITMNSDDYLKLVNPQVTPFAI